MPREGIKLEELPKTARKISGLHTKKRRNTYGWGFLWNTIRAIERAAENGAPLPRQNYVRLCFLNGSAFAFCFFCFCPFLFRRISWLDWEKTGETGEIPGCQGDLRGTEFFFFFLYLHFLFYSFLYFIPVKKGSLRNILLDPARASGSERLETLGEKSHSAPPRVTDRIGLSWRRLLTGSGEDQKTDSDRQRVIFILFGLVDNLWRWTEYYCRKEAVNDFLVSPLVTMMMVCYRWLLGDLARPSLDASEKKVKS